MKKIVFSIVLGLLPFCSQAKIETIHDVLGRDVSVDIPAKRVLLGFYTEDYMAIAGKDSLKNVVGISRDTWEKWRPASWKLNVEHNPKLNDIPDVGEVESQTFSVEKVLSLNPDIILLADWQYKGLGADIQRIEDAGIPIVVVDYNAQTLKRHLESTRIIGRITGQEKRAKQIADEYESAIRLIEKRIADAHVPKPKVYIEYGSKGPAEYGFTYGKNMWGAMLSQAGGDNIAAPYVKWWGPINPEQVLAAKPDVIFISGRELSHVAGAMLMGEGITRDTAVKRLNGFTKRLGWSELPAVKHNRVFGIYHGASRSILDYTMTQYLAKALYPDLFKDLNPEKAYLDFYRRYLPVSPHGTFTVHITE